MDTGETVYQLIPPPQEILPKPKRYKSKHVGAIDPHDFQMGISQKRGNGTMGKPLGAYAPHQTEFLTKHSKEPVLPDPGPPTIKKSKLKAEVPKRTEAPVMGMATQKNFVVTNAVENILQKPKKVQDEYEFYTARPGFGEIPKYLEKNKQRIDTEKEQLKAYMRAREEEITSSDVSRMDEEERQDLIHHLKLKWSSVNTAYQKLSFTLDTVAKRRRKEEYEQVLAEIERDIQTLQKGDVVIVFDD